MGIRAEAQSSHFDSYPVEEDLAQRFDEGFDITFGRPFGQLSMWLADPKPHIRERFGFAKEILVIYSRHAKTDARVLSAIENITRNPEFRHRLDRAIVFLVHAGQPDQVANLLKDRLDWIVVPFTTTEITDPHRGPLFLRSRIAASIGNLDLFGMSSPITDDRYFFGRSDLVQQMITRLVERHENTGLFGLRKTGKTSVMFAIQRRLADRAVLVEYLDCQNPGIHAARWWQVLEGIVNRCKCTARTTKGRTTEQSSDYTEHNAGMRFLDDLRVLMTECSYDHLVLMFDEIEYITPNISGALGRHWDSDFISFWQTIRAVHQELQGRLSFCVAGVNPASV